MVSWKSIYQGRWEGDLGGKEETGKLALYEKKHKAEYNSDLHWKKRKRCPVLFGSAPWIKRRRDWGNTARGLADHTKKRKATSLKTTGYILSMKKTGWSSTNRGKWKKKRKKGMKVKRIDRS